ncbi:hypothetical protein BJ170DRAFT_684761 [Xylariales sp. AK1849]|nr:hypothetical protein BJ170DRAFT_684761 [Xylariales sp. AK1849]
MDPAVRSLGSSLLNGCCHEAERAERVGNGLEGLRNSLHDKFHPHLNGVIEEVHRTSRLLRDLADQSQVHMSRVPVVIDYLNVILPCLCKSLMDIREFYEDRSQSKERRWRTMYHSMGNELPGTTLPARFIMYNQYLQLLQLLLTKSPNFDMNGLESLRTRILQLREARNIPPPSPIQRAPIVWRDTMDYWEEETDSHWAESIFTRPLPSRTELEKPSRAISQAYGPLQRLGHIKISPDVRTLVKRSFDNDRLSVTFFLQTFNEAPYLLIRTVRGGQPWVSALGAHELCIKRHDCATLIFTRWSRSEDRKMILFYCTFICLKARSIETVDVNPTEFNLRKEKRLFQASVSALCANDLQILDDGYNHSLAVYQDAYTGRRRLHASVWDSALKDCPVWTSFLPDDKQTNQWLLHKSRHRIWVRDIQPYVFCQKYRAQHQRKGKAGAFELFFVNETAASRFKELFEPDEPPAATVDSSDQGAAGPSGG